MDRPLLGSATTTRAKSKAGFVWLAVVLCTVFAAIPLRDIRGRYASPSESTERNDGERGILSGTGTDNAIAGTDRTGTNMNGAEKSMWSPNANSVVSSADKDGSKEVDKRCFLKPDSGPCMAFFRRYFFNRDKSSCDVFYWGGCDGVVPFLTVSECEKAHCASQLKRGAIRKIEFEAEHLAESGS